VTGVPSENTASLRSLIVQTVRSSDNIHSVARSGLVSRFISRRSNVDWNKGFPYPPHPANGSNPLSGSPPMASTNESFELACANMVSPNRQTVAKATLRRIISFPQKYDVLQK